MGTRSGGRRGLIAVLVYRSATRCAAPSALIEDIAALVAALGDAPPDAGTREDVWTELLIACGELQSAVTDVLSPVEDELASLGAALDELTVAAASGALRAWNGAGATAALASVMHAIDRVRGELGSHILPPQLEIGVPEGFAYYGLYPETYAAAARALLDRYSARRFACIGIRSIGTTLGAVVTATLRDAGRCVASYTVRPRGHPFDRTLTIGPALRAALAGDAAAGAIFVVVDEGPGLSGSSFASVADTIGAMDVADSRIVFLPSWEPTADVLRSARGRDRWSRHPKLSVPAEAILEGDHGSLQIARRLVDDVAGVENVSGGEWRRVVYEDERDWPAVQPQHERRKYLLRDAHGTPLALLKFAGLARFGRAAAERARALAHAQLAPRVLGAARGFLATEWVDGVPACEGEADADLLPAIARHVAHLAMTTSTRTTAPVDALLQIVRVNTAESLGEEVAERLVEALERFRPVIRTVRTCAVDGRMLPHEWVRSSRGWLKLDGVDHHDDHFLPGDQDPAWDIAGAIVELLLDARQRRALIELYVRASGDRELAARLPFQHVVYLATRLGYVALAAESLGDHPDAVRLRALARRYTAMLRRAAVTLGAIDALPLPARWRHVRVIAFDADGTLRCTTVPGGPCPHAPDEWRLLPWVADGTLARLAWGEALALGAASNQDHVGYGHLSERQARALLRSMLVEATGHVPDREAVQLCPHVLEVACTCRKPQDGMLRALVAHFGIAPDALLFVGDAATDAEAARRAGIRFARVEEFAHALRNARRATPARAVVGSAA